METEISLTPVVESSKTEEQKTPATAAATAKTGATSAATATAKTGATAAASAQPPPEPMEEEVGLCTNTSVYTHNFCEPKNKSWT